MSTGERPQEAPLVCHLCGRAVGAAQYESHLRSEHGLVTYRGVRRGLPETLEAIRFDLLADPPSQAAWLAVQHLAREEQASAAADWLAGWLATALCRLSPERLASLAGPLAAILMPGSPGFLAALASRPEPAPRLVALEAISLLPAPLPPELLKPVRPLIYERSHGEDAQARIVTAALGDPLGAGLAARMLRWFTAKLPPEEAVRRLRLLGNHPLVTESIARLSSGIPLPCPRCGVRLRQEDLEKHLWLTHRLLLDGDKPRDPWELVADWARLYRAKGDAQWLHRCRAAATRLDPVGGAEKLERLLLATGAAEPAARLRWFTDARERNASCCPACFAFVPVPREVPVLEVSIRPGRLSAGGYEVEVSNHGLRTRLLVKTPTETIHDGPESGQPFSALGAATVYAGPLLVLAFVTSCLWPVAWLGSPLPVVVFLLLLSGLVGLYAWLLSSAETPTPARILNYTWTMLVPRLKGSVNTGDSAFLAGLARLCSRLERADAPPALLRAQIQAVADALQRRTAPPSHLAPLCRLQAEQAAARGEDPVGIVERWVAQCFDGKLPLAFAQGLLEEWATTWWTAGQLARLRVRLCDRAFEAGFEVQGLIDAGNNAPALGAVLGGEARSLAALRVMWALRPARPWEKLGEASTAFELATDPGRVSLFEVYPGVMLWQEVRDSLIVAEGIDEPMRQATIVLTLDGVWVQGELFTAPPRVFEMILRSMGCELKLDERVFRSSGDLEPLSRLLEKWFRLAFHEILPQVDRAREWVSPDRAALLRAWGAVPCPECGKFLLPRVGEVGLALESES